MARQKLVWFTNGGVIAESEADAKLGDASEDLKNLINQRAYSQLDKDDIYNMLTSFDDFFINALVAYNQAVIIRDKEVNG